MWWDGGMWWDVVGGGVLVVVRWEVGAGWGVVCVR